MNSIGQQTQKDTCLTVAPSQPTQHSHHAAGGSTAAAADGFAHSSTIFKAQCAEAADLSLDSATSHQAQRVSPCGSPIEAAGIIQSSAAAGTQNGLDERTLDDWGWQPTQLTQGQFEFDNSYIPSQAVPPVTSHSPVGRGTSRQGTRRPLLGASDSVRQPVRHAAEQQAFAASGKTKADAPQHVPFAIKKVKLQAVKPPIRLVGSAAALLDNTQEMLPVRRQIGKSSAKPVPQSQQPRGVTYLPCAY